jgi:hypothetical protein
MKNKLAKRIELLERLRTDMESKYGPEDVLVLDLVQEIKALHSKSSEQKKNWSARAPADAVKSKAAAHS